MGRLSDYSRKWVIVVSLAAAMVSYLILASADSIPMLFVSRLPVGFLKQTESTSFAVVADLTTPDERTRFLGYVSSALGMGFIVGPVLSGILSEYQLEWPIYVACGLFAFAVLLTLVLLPSNLRSYAPGMLISADGAQAHHLDTPKSENGIPEQPGSNNSSNGRLGFFATVVQSATLRPVFIIHFAVAFATTLFQSNFVLVLEELGLPPRHSAFMFAYMGVIGVITSSFILRFLTQRWSEPYLISRSIFAAGCALLLFPLLPTVTGFMCALVPFVVSLRVLRSCLMSSITTRAPKERTGAVLGLADAVESGNRAVAPIVGGALIEAFGTFSPAFLGSSVVLAAAGYLTSTNVLGE